MDLLVDLETGNAAQSMQVLSALGMKSRAPVASEDFADEAKRDDWFRNRNLHEFQLR